MHFVEAKGILQNKNGYHGMNIYRGCTHGCIYCDSRSLCYQFTHQFEDIEVKKNAPEVQAQQMHDRHGFDVRSLYALRDGTETDQKVS